MAYLVVNSKYNPFSFEEMVKPFQMYGEEYRNQEAMMDAARDKEFSGSALDQTLDKAAYDMYNSATTSLRGVADELATNGLSPELRGRIKSVARDYKTTMDALNEAQTRLYAEQDRRAKLGPDYVYQQNDLRIGDFLNGATPNQRGESLEKITKDIGTEFTARAQRITQDTWNKAMSSNGRVVGGYYDVTTETGLSAAQLDTILSDADTWNSIMKDSSISDSQKALLQGFRNTIESKKRALDYGKYDDADKSRIDEAITVGAHYGLGKVTHEHRQDPGYNPLGWAKFNYEVAAAEAPFTHSDEEHPSIKNRTGLTQEYKDLLEAQNEAKQAGKPSTSSSTGGTSGNTRIPVTKGLTLHTHSAGTKPYSGLSDAAYRAATANITLSTVAAMDIVDHDELWDPEIAREALGRLNVSTYGVGDAQLKQLMRDNIDGLNQLTIKISGNKETPRKYAWSVEDKTSGLSGQSSGETNTSGYQSTERKIDGNSKLLPK